MHCTTAAMNESSSSSSGCHGGTSAVKFWHRADWQITSSPVCDEKMLILIILNIKQWRSILELVLANCANSFKDNLVLLDAVAEAIIKAFKILESGVESFVTGPSAALELSQFWGILRVRHADDFLLSFVPIVTDDSFTARDFLLQLLSENGDVMFSSWQRATDPHKLLFENWCGYFAVKCSLIIFVRAAFWILGKCRMLGLTNAGVNPIHGHGEYFVPSFGPNDLNGAPRQF